MDFQTHLKHLLRSYFGCPMVHKTFQEVHQELYKFCSKGLVTWSPWQAGWNIKTVSSLFIPFHADKHSTAAIQQFQTCEIFQIFTSLGPNCGGGCVIWKRAGGTSHSLLSSSVWMAHTPMISGKKMGFLNISRIFNAQKPSLPENLIDLLWSFDSACNSTQRRTEADLETMLLWWSMMHCSLNLQVLCNALVGKERLHRFLRSLHFPTENSTSWRWQCGPRTADSHLIHSNTSLLSHPKVIKWY